MNTVLTSLALAFLSLSGAPSEIYPSDVVARWVFSSEHYENGAIQPIEGGRPLTVEDPEFFGEGESESMVIPKAMMTYEVLARDLPKKALSIEAWVAPQPSAKFAAIVCAGQDNADDESGFYLCLREDCFTFWLKSEETREIQGDDGEFLFSDEVYAIGEWHHVVATYDGKTKKLYVNGKLSDSSSHEKGDIYFLSKHPLTVGAFNDSNEKIPLSGALHEVAIYEKAISPYLIKSNYKKLAGKLPPLAGELPGPVSRKDTVDTLEPAINQAIFLGVEHLLLNQHRDGSWDYMLTGQRNGATSLAIYTLLQCGLEPDHPAILKGLDFLERKDPETTYSAGVQLLALGANHKRCGEGRDWAQRIRDRLLEWESKEQEGAWGYPGSYPCLSNTHFAALGFWGVSDLKMSRSKSYKDVWKRLLENLPLHRRPGANNKKPSAGASVGFTYRRDAIERPENSTMTAAGLTIIGLARLVGERSSKTALRNIQEESDQAYAYIKKNYGRMNDAGRPVGGWSNENLYYYYFCLEHLGAFFEQEKIGGNDWYLDGVRNLLKRQSPPGLWNTGGPWGDYIQTCFALLFLRKASHEEMFGDAVTHDQFGFQEKEGDVHLSVSLDEEGPATLSVTGFEEGFLSHYELESRQWWKLPIANVEYFVDGLSVQKILGDPAGFEQLGYYDVEHVFDSPGYHDVRVSVDVLPPQASAEGLSAPISCESGSLRVVSRTFTDVWMRTNLVSSDDDLLASAETIVARCSSHHAALSGGAQQACDELHATRWACHPDDDDPSIMFELEPPVKAGRVRLSQANSCLAMRGHFGAIQRVSISINDRKPKEYALALDDLLYSDVKLGSPKAIESLEIRILERTPGRQGLSVGFSGIELFRN